MVSPRNHHHHFAFYHMQIIRNIFNKKCSIEISIVTLTYLRNWFYKSNYSDYWCIFVLVLGQFWDSVRTKWGHLGVQIYLFIDFIVCRYLYLHFLVSYSHIAYWHDTIHCMHYINMLYVFMVSQLHKIKRLCKSVCILYLPFTHIHQYG